jgi:DNA-binding GntR family transcriptional regulator
MASTVSSLTSRLALQVIEHARRHGLEPGAHLIEQNLADAFRVSRSPIRKALALLADQGVLLRESNRGYFLKALPTHAARAPLHRSAATDEEPYFRIADDRLAGRLQDHVTETALMQRYGIARREMQRILHRMEKEGWVERKAGRGWIFAGLSDSVEAHEDGYRFRMLIEPAALLEPKFRIDRTEFEQCRRDQQMLLDGGFFKVSRARLFELGSNFHETLVGFSGNRFLLDALKRVNSMRRLLEYRAHLDRPRLLGQCHEHLELLNLLETGSRQDAARFLRKHLDIARAIKTEPAGKSANTTNHVAAQF